MPTVPVKDMSYLIKQIKEGDELASQSLWQEFSERLMRLAKQRLGPRDRRVGDEEDVVNSAFEVFFRGVASGTFAQLATHREVGALLATLTVRQASLYRAMLQAEKRGGGKVRGDSAMASPLDSTNDGFGRVPGDCPTPSEVVMAEERMAELMDRLNDNTLRQVAAWKMEGFTNHEIAELLECSTRTVKRKLNLISEMLGLALK